MALKSGSTGTDKKDTGRNKDPIVMGLIALTVVAIMVIATYAIATAYSIGSAEGSCAPAPAPYETIHSQNVTLLNGDGSDGAMFTVVRGILGYGKPQIVDGKKPLTFPLCYSNDKDLMTVTDVSIKMSDGTKAHLVVGVVPLSVNQPEVPAPTPVP